MNQMINDEIPYVTADLRPGLYLNLKTGEPAWIKRRRFRQVWNQRKKRLEHGHWYVLELHNGQKGDQVFISKKQEKVLFFVGRV